jgi:hypothetical protein
MAILLHCRQLGGSVPDELDVTLKNHESDVSSRRCRKLSLLSIPRDEEDEYDNVGQTGYTNLL